MTVFPTYDVDDLAEFTGRPEMTFPAYIDEALSQAVLFIQLRTKIHEWPDDPELRKVFRYAILDLANKLYLEREYDKIKSNPLQSETIGSYSYSKSNAAQSALYTARPTGLLWLDTLLELLREDYMDAVPSHGSTHVFEDEDVWLVDGERTVLGPMDRPEKLYARRQRRRSNPNSFNSFNEELPGDIF